VKVEAHFMGLDRTGGNVVLFRYIDALLARGHEVAIATLGKQGDRRFLPEPTNVPCTYVGLRDKPYRALMHATRGALGYPAREVRRLAGAASPEADLRLATYTFTVFSALRAGGPVHHHVQHHEVLLQPTARLERLIEDALRCPDVYRTANCTWVAERIADVGGDVRGIVMPAIDHDVFTPGRRRPAGDDASRPFRVITLGKAVDWKGLVDVVAACEILARDTGPVELVSYGADRPKVGGSVRLEHHGLVDSARLAELYRSADVCVSGSWYESFPLPPLEAMATGTPVVCTRIGTEDYAFDDVNSLIVPPKDPEAMAAAMRRIREDADLRRELVANGLSTAALHRWVDAEQSFVRHAETAAGVRPAAPATA
jgi:glycosyltransferase involved in cell wall biosynthesis